MANIIVGLSGGVDSSVTAHLLKQQGLEVTAVFMKNWEDNDSAYCTAAKDFNDAQAVCRKLKIPLIPVNFAEEYWERVFDYFLTEYLAGRTPNPDILCNQEIKFKAFLDYALAQGAEKIATGHYANITEHGGQYLLQKGEDPNKDQSYFLHRLNQYQLAHSLFPIGGYHKPDIRAIATELGLKTATKKDSTGICFIGERKFKDFLQQYLPAQPGEMRTPEGTVIGQHDGLMYYTIGQRQGLGIGGTKTGSEEPWYVADKDLDNNVLIVVQGDHPLLYKALLNAEQMHWISGQPRTGTFRCSAKTRYRQSDQLCHVTCLDDTHIEVLFDTPQRAITPGQSVVLYDETICLGGGIIQ